MSQFEKILIVDDEPDTVTILRDRLENGTHYEVITASSGNAALEQIDRDLPGSSLVRHPNARYGRLGNAVTNSSEISRTFGDDVNRTRFNSAGG